MDSNCLHQHKFKTALLAYRELLLISYWQNGKQNLACHLEDKWVLIVKCKAWNNSNLCSHRAIFLIIFLTWYHGCWLSYYTLSPNIRYLVLISLLIEASSLSTCSENKEQAVQVESRVEAIIKCFLKRTKKTFHFFSSLLLCLAPS